MEPRTGQAEAQGARRGLSLPGVIAARLALLVFAVAAVGSIVSALVVRHLVEHESRESVETTATVLARAVARGLDRNDPSATREPLHGFFEREGAVFASVLDREGRPMESLGDRMTSDPGDAVVASLEVTPRGDLWIARVPVRNGASERLGTLVLGWKRSESNARALGWISVLVACGLAAAAVAGGLGLLEARRLTAPLSRLAVRASALAEGRAAPAVPEPGPREVASIACALEALARRFEETRSELERETRDLERKVRERTTELRQKHLTLALQNEQILEASRLKSAFLANMSHELRTPLHAILALSELLRDEIVGPLANEEQKRQVGIIHQSGQNLLRLINDVLDLSKIEAGKMELRVELGDAQGVLTGICEELRPLAESKGLLFSFRTEGVGAGWFDSDRLRQVVQNLVGNAIKFTERGSVEIRSRLDLEAERLTVDVRDTGVGIEREDQETIFQEFRQVDGSSSRRFGGTGLGLAICHRLVKLMGGEIWVESEVGRGSTFTVQVPIRRMRPAVDGNGAPLAESPSPSRPTPTMHANALTSGGTEERARILVIEDDDRALESLVRVMALEGFDLRVASDGREAWEEFQRDLPDLVVLDLMLPGVSGFELLELFSDGGRPRVPIVVHTAKDLTRADWKILDRSVERVFHKGDTGVRLMVDEIHRLLDERRRMQSRRVA